jgi:hypothetical protein
MRYRGENLVENSVNEGCRGWNLKDIAGDSLKMEPFHSISIHPTNQTHLKHTNKPTTGRDFFWTCLENPILPPSVQECEEF